MIMANQYRIKLELVISSEHLVAAGDAEEFASEIVEEIKKNHLFPEETIVLTEVVEEEVVAQ